MAKNRANIPSISEAVKNLKRGNILPVYYFFGEDSFSIDISLKAIEEAVKPFLASDFDREIFYSEERTLIEVLDAASAFPFGSDKKLIIYKDFEKVRDKKNLLSYIESPAEFTVLVLVHNGAVSNPGTNLYSALIKNKFLYEAKELKGRNLITWLVDYCEENKKQITSGIAQVLVEIVGENRSMLEAQLDKIFTFVGDKIEITIDDVRNLSTSLKEFSIFDLQDAISKKDKRRAMKLAYNLLDKGQEPTFIIHMLTRYFSGLARINEMTEKKMNEYAAAKIIGTHPYYLKNYKFARRNYTDGELFSAAQALLKADLAIKTSSTNNKEIITLLISEMVN